MRCNAPYYRVATISPVCFHQSEYSAAPVGLEKTRRLLVLDLNCRAHEVYNLYVVDSSFFPSHASVSPGLTVIANALRVGDRLIEQLK